MRGRSPSLGTRLGSSRRPPSPATRRRTPQAGAAPCTCQRQAPPLLHPPRLRTPTRVVRLPPPPALSVTRPGPPSPGSLPPGPAALPGPSPAGAPGPAFSAARVMLLDPTRRVDSEAHVHAAPMPRVQAIEQVDAEEAPRLRRVPHGAHDEPRKGHVAGRQDARFGEGAWGRSRGTREATSRQVRAPPPGWSRGPNRRSVRAPTN